MYPHVSQKNVCQILQYPHIGPQKKDLFFVKKMQYLRLGL
jgi:hypothetical protein